MSSAASTCGQLFYRLVTSPELLLKYRNCPDLEQLLQGLVTDLNVEGLSSTQLFDEIQQGGQQILPIPLTTLRSSWLPSGYQAQKQQCSWRLKPPALPFAPFYDDRLSKGSGNSLLSALLRPVTELQHLLTQAHCIDRRRPAGFIFHLSRCGSTLLANALAATGVVQVISEASFLTDLLLDHALANDQKNLALQTLLSLFELPTMVKFNAWDTGFLPLLRRAFPDTPILFLIRDPFSILVSHRRFAGIHMVPATPVARYLNVPMSDSPFGHHCAVLKQLMTTMYQQHQASIKVLDYDQLSPAGVTSIEVIEQVCKYFSLPLSLSQRQGIIDIISHDAKAPEQRFIAKDGDKHHDFAHSEFRFIQQRLMPEYVLLLSLVERIPSD